MFFVRFQIKLFFLHSSFSFPFSVVQFSFLASLQLTSLFLLLLFSSLFSDLLQLHFRPYQICTQKTPKNIFVSIEWKLSRERVVQKGENEKKKETKVLAEYKEKNAIFCAFLRFLRRKKCEELRWFEFSFPLSLSLSFLFTQNNFLRQLK